MVLRRPEICRLIEFNSWTGVQRWLSDVASEPFRELVEDYLRPFDQRGEKSPLNYEGVKNHIINHSSVLETMVQMRVAELQGGIERRLPNKAGWGQQQHYERFIVEAVALDRLAEARAAHRHNIAHKQWSRDENTLYYYMYELTEALCHNYWKPAETELWDLDDSDVPFSDGNDIC